MAASRVCLFSRKKVWRLSRGQPALGGGGAFFYVDCANPRRAGGGRLTPWLEKILNDYIASLEVELHANAPIFRTPGTVPGPKGGRRWLPQPYSKDKLGEHFRVVRAAVFGPHETRQLADMRRSGAVEGDAGGGS